MHIASTSSMPAHLVRAGKFVCEKKCACPADGDSCELDATCLPDTMQCLEGLVLIKHQDGSTEWVGAAMREPWCLLCAELALMWARPSAPLALSSFWSAAPSCGVARSRCAPARFPAAKRHLHTHIHIHMHARTHACTPGWVHAWMGACRCGPSAELSCEEGTLRLDFTVEGGSVYGVCVCGAAAKARVRAPPGGPNCTFTSPLPPPSPKEPVKPEVCAALCVRVRLCSMCAAFASVRVGLWV